MDKNIFTKFYQFNFKTSRRDKNQPLLTIYRPVSKFETGFYYVIMEKDEVRMFALNPDFVEKKPGF